MRWASSSGWTWILLAYAWLASVLPVWSLLQPRDFLNSLLLYLGLGLTYIGFFILRPEFAAPIIDTHPVGAPPMYPFVFIVIACGAASGFHSLVSSGTTAKQLDRETRRPPDRLRRHDRRVAARAGGGARLHRRFRIAGGVEAPLRRLGLDPGPGHAA